LVEPTPVHVVSVVEWKPGSISISLIIAMISAVGVTFAEESRGAANA
jgi:hypothetical protein